jgi:hypothetical protein
MLAITITISIIQLCIDSEKPGFDSPRTRGRLFGRVLMHNNILELAYNLLVVVGT